jgi:hypothetical protein
MAVNREDYLSMMEQAANRVPYWARSTNPIVRRHLGLNWRTLPPQMQPLIMGVGIWSLILFIGLILPIVRDTAAMLFLSSIIVLPVTGLLYAHVLVTIAVTAADTMQEEMRNNTLSLLRTTPMSLEQIFLGKIAVALWKRMDDLVLVSQVVVAFAPPILLVVYSEFWALDQYPVLSQVMVIISLIVSLLRLIIEPVFIGTLAIFISVLVPNRATAITGTVALSVFYFVMINLVNRLPFIRGAELLDGTIIPPNHLMIGLFEFVLPLLLPALLSYVFLRLAVRTVTAD